MVLCPKMSTSRVVDGKTTPSCDNKFWRSLTILPNSVCRFAQLLQLGGSLGAERLPAFLGRSIFAKDSSWAVGPGSAIEWPFGPKSPHVLDMNMLHSVAFFGGTILSAATNSILPLQVPSGNNVSFVAAQGIGE
jgi:hypothetical protein